MSATAPAAADRLAGAIAASLCLHGALLAGLQVLPRLWPAASPFGGDPPARQLRVQFAPASAPIPPVVHAQNAAPAAPRKAMAAVAPQGTPQGSGREATPGFLPAPIYYSALELDRRPQPLQRIEPLYPTLALAPVGRVTLALYISEDGDVDRLEVEADDPNGAFAESARKAFGNARFLPGLRNGIAVKSLMRIEVRFGEAAPHAPGGQDAVEREKFIPKVRVRPAR